MNPFRAVVFGLDGVLYPQWEYALGGYRAVADYMMTVYGTPIYDELERRHHSGSTESLLADVLSGHFNNIEANFLHKLISVYWSHKPCIKLCPDARACLSMMRSVNVKTSVVTDGPSDIQRTKAESLKLPKLVDQVLYAGDLLGEEKMRDSLQMSELLIGVPLRETMYVGSMVSSGFEAARDLGMYAALVKRPVHANGKRMALGDSESEISSIAETHANLVVSSLTELTPEFSVEKRID